MCIWNEKTSFFQLETVYRLNFADMEIEMFFSRYDKDGNFTFDMEEANEIFEDLDNARLDIGSARPTTGRQARDQRRDRIITANSRGNATMDEFEVLTGRVNRMETSIGSIVSKIDTVLIKLETLEKSKAKRKAAMSKILGTITEGAGGDNADEEAKRAQMEEMVKQELNEWESESSSRPSTG